MCSLKTTSQNQNDLICAVEEWIQENILEEVREAKFLSVCADEAADSSNKEQLSLMLRFVDKTGVVREEFISFLLCEFGTTGEALSKIIITALSKYALDVGYLRGQSYDGAGNMAGKYEGVAAQIQRDYPKVKYCSYMKFIHALLQPVVSKQLEICIGLCNKFVFF